MQKKQMLFKTKGMNQDLSVSAFNPEFAFENRNLRLSTNDGNTMLSWVNEKGTEELTTKDSNDDVVNIKGVPIGTAVINRQLVLFVYENTNSHYIYKLQYKDDSKTTLEVTELYHGNLGFSKENPIETLVSYESESIQKVYWVDGKNQPRMINIADSAETLRNLQPTAFDFISTLQLNEKIKVRKIIGASGTFAAGVIQYAFTYYRKNGAESNIFYTTPLLYVSPAGRGAAPDERVDNAFRITIENPDIHFDYLRIYSIQRTSINGTPIVKRVQDIELKNLNAGATISYLDTGTSGNSVDPTELLYKGGYEIVASTLEQKDNTLFLGNIKMQKSHIDNTPKNNELGLRDRIKASIAENQAKPIRTAKREVYCELSNSSSYKYANQLTGYKSKTATGQSVPCGGFKNGEWYRLGVQFQHTSGRWSEPIWIKDYKTSYEYTDPNNYGDTVFHYPKLADDENDDTFQRLTLPTIKGHLNDVSVKRELYDEGYRKVRPVVVFPSLYDREVLCQATACPTLYRPCDQNTNDNQLKGNIHWSSWFFRTYQNGSEVDDNNVSVTPKGIVKKPMGGAIGDIAYDNITGELIDGTSYQLDYTDNSTPSEGDITLLNSEADAYTAWNIKHVEIQGQYKKENRFFIDPEFCTFHSPDMEFDTQIQLVNFDSFKPQRVGYIEMQKTISGLSIQTESPTISNNGGGPEKLSLDSPEWKGIVSGLFYDDYLVDENDGNFEAYRAQKNAVKFMVYLWNKNGSLNNDVTRPADKGVASAVLKKKVISNLRFSDTLYNPNTFASDTLTGFSTSELFTSEEVEIAKCGDITHMGNVDSMVIPDENEGMYFAYNGSEGELDDTEPQNVTLDNRVSWKTFGNMDNISDDGIYNLLYKGENVNKFYWQGYFNSIGDGYVDLAINKSPVRIKFKSTPHLAGTTNVFSDWTNKGLSGKLPVIDIVRSNSNTQRFGGHTSDAFKENIWIPCGEPEKIYKVVENNDGTTTISFNNDVEIEYLYGDTYYQRWDCLKTYPFTNEDVNQVVEIGSFMLETRVNIDGRYDKNRGQSNNLYVSPQNFNLMNLVYSQIDNFFTYRIMDEDYYKDESYPNQITWSKTKESGADVDMWTNVTLASMLELDGDKGQLNKIIRLNDSLIAFQDKGISQILYNENTQISTTQGVPIEIANSGKVQGKRYISNTIGCSNKHSIVSTPSGIYFMDNNDKSIFLFNGQLTNISLQGGMNAWCKQNIHSQEIAWLPNYGIEGDGNGEAFTAFYDKLNQDVLFINGEQALAWSEKLSAFTSFYDYGGVPYFCNLDDTGIWLRPISVNENHGTEEEPDTEKVEYIKLWKHQANSEHCCFFGEYKPYSTTLVGNPEPQMDKIFTNLEFRACVEGEMTSEQKPVFLLPFDSLEVKNEYQEGTTALQNRNGHSAMLHGEGNTSSLKRKFRIWRCDIPRDSHNKRDRMRNPWLYLTLSKTPKVGGAAKVEVHDIVMTYFE